MGVPGTPLSFDAHHELGELSKVAQLFALVFVICAARGRQDVNARAIKQVFLHAVVALALGKLFIGKLAVEGHDARAIFFQLLRKHDASLGKILSLQLLNPFGRALHQIRKADTEFNHAFVIVVIKRLRHHPALVEHGPKLIAPSGIVMADADGRLARIATDDHQLHAFTEMVGEGTHDASLLCLSIFFTCP